jgi:hypothetical protein
MIFCNLTQSKLVFHGIFRLGVAQDQIDEFLILYMRWLMDPVTNPDNKPLAPTMARPCLCTPILWNMIFGRWKVSGTRAWGVVKEHEQFYLKGEPVRLSLVEYRQIFQDLAVHFKSLHPPFNKDRAGNQKLRDLVGITATVFTTVLSYRAGNVLDATVSPDVFEAPLEDFIKYHPSTEFPEKLTFQTPEKMDKAGGKVIRRSRVVSWIIRDMCADLDPVKVLDKYYKAMGMTRESRKGPIRKGKGVREKFTLNSFTRAEFTIWLGQLVERGTISSLSSLPEGKSLNARIMRRTMMSFFADVSSLQETQRLVGHKHVSTTADIYVGFEADELANVRVSRTFALLKIIQLLLEFWTIPLIHRAPDHSDLPLRGQTAGQSLLFER